MLIIDDKMPKNCEECRYFNQDYYYFCVLNEEVRAFPLIRPQDCPIRELPPHGRLIDADALQEYYEALDADNGDYTESASETAETIANALTILEASE